VTLATVIQASSPVAAVSLPSSLLSGRARSSDWALCVFGRVQRSVHLDRRIYLSGDTAGVPLSDRRLRFSRLPAGSLCAAGDVALDNPAALLLGDAMHVLELLPEFADPLVPSCDRLGAAAAPRIRAVEPAGPHHGGPRPSSSWSTMGFPRPSGCPASKPDYFGR